MSVTQLMQGKRGIIMGLANDHSIAWGIAKAAVNAGAEIGLTYQGGPFEKRVRPLADQLGVDALFECDVEDENAQKDLADKVAQKWENIDFVVHAIAFSDKNELKGKFADTSRANFSRTMLISCFSFVETARHLTPLMNNGGSLVTLTYAGATRAMPNYNVMGVAKSALESSVRYLAADYGDRNIRVNAISAGPIRTLAGAGIGDARKMFGFQNKHAPLEHLVGIDEVGGSALYLISDLSKGVTGEIHFVDGGYNMILMPKPQNLD